MKIWDIISGFAKKQKGFRLDFIYLMIFLELVDILHPDIAVCKGRSKVSTGGNTPINPEIITAIGVQFTGGGTLNLL